VSRLGGSRTSILGTAAVAVVAFAVALGAVAWLAVRATQQATTGAAGVQSEFAEHVQGDAAMLAVQDNYRVAHDRMRARTAREAERLDRQLDASDARLGQALGAALRDHDPDGGTARLAGRVRAAYPAYITVRERVIRRAGPDGETDADRQAMRRAFDALQGAQEAFASTHFDTASDHLQDLRDTGHWRAVALAVALLSGIAGLLTVVLLVRRVATRVREYAVFAGRVADGNLAMRLQPRGRDELAGLALSLNAMVEELSIAAEQRNQVRVDDRAYRASQDAFSDAMQVTASEPEAHGLLKLHIERWVPGSEALVISRSASTNQLHAGTPVAEDSALGELLHGAEPRSCLAVRLARTHESAGNPPPLLECELCGRTAVESTCVPLLVSGQVIGSVLVEHTRLLHADERRRVADSVGQAAPTLANLRNLALAEARAATDSLTGLPNRRAVQEALTRMTAQAGRTLSPMAVLLLDLDHFKQINDGYGHDQGDAVLAAVGDVLGRSLRTSDFVGRNGGEEFIVLLPDTGAEGALEAAEKLRAAIARLMLPGIERPVTTSVGAAVYPYTAADVESLLRLADRALYVAKAGGRNRVALAESMAGGPPEE
jgi:diguanylate cyclase (GGDEF)-like protein